MRKECLSYLTDALSAAREILELGGPNGSAYRNSRRDALAIERLFEVLGVAFVRIRALEPEVLDQISDSVAIIGMRNFIAHG